jgi:hypothetical protein
MKSELVYRIDQFAYILKYGTNGYVIQFGKVGIHLYRNEMVLIDELAEKVKEMLDSVASKIYSKGAGQNDTTAG